MKLYKPKNLMVIAITMIVIALGTVFLSAYTVQKQREKCNRCKELEFAIEQVLTIVLEDNTDYYLDVLCETDEYCNLYELLNEDCKISDSTHYRRNVYPDAPAVKAKPDSKPHE